MHTYILAQKQPSLPPPFHPSSLSPLCLVFPFLPLASLSLLYPRSLWPTMGPHRAAALLRRTLRAERSPPFHLGEWMSRARGLVRVARCWAHVLRGEGCEGASEGWGRGVRGQERPAGTGVLMLDNNAYFYFLDA